MTTWHAINDIGRAFSCLLFELWVLGAWGWFIFQPSARERSFRWLVATGIMYILNWSFK